MLPSIKHLTRTGLFAEAKVETTITIEFAQGKGEGSWGLGVGKNQREFLVGKENTLKTFPILVEKGKQQISLMRYGKRMGVVKSVRLKGAEMTAIMKQSFGFTDADVANY